MLARNIIQNGARIQDEVSKPKSYILLLNFFFKCPTLLNSHYEITSCHIYRVMLFSGQNGKTWIFLLWFIVVAFYSHCYVLLRLSMPFLVFSVKRHLEFWSLFEKSQESHCLKNICFPSTTSNVNVFYLKPAHSTQNYLFL